MQRILMLLIAASAVAMPMGCQQKEMAEPVEPSKPSPGLEETIENGLTVRRYDNGQKSYEGLTRDGLREGKWTLWFGNGAKQAEGEYKKGKREGKWTFYTSEGVINDEITFKQDVHDGPITNYREGKKESMFHRKEGVSHGLYQRWYPDGTLREEGQFVSGLNDGLWTSYHKNGKVQRTTEYKLGQIVGTQIAYDEEGKEEQRTVYKEGRPVEEPAKP